MTDDSIYEQLADMTSDLDRLDIYSQEFAGAVRARMHRRYEHAPLDAVNGEYLWLVAELNDRDLPVAAAGPIPHAYNSRGVMANKIARNYLCAKRALAREDER